MIEAFTPQHHCCLLRPHHVASTSSAADKGALSSGRPAEVEPPVTVMSTATDTDQAEYVSHMVQYLLTSNQVQCSAVRCSEVRHLATISIRISISVYFVRCSYTTRLFLPTEVLPKLVFCIMI